MHQEIEIKVLPHQVDDLEWIRKQAEKSLKRTILSVEQIQIHKRSIDARAKQVVFRLMVRVYQNPKAIPTSSIFHFQSVKDAPTVIIVGAGPAGLFAALQCIKNRFRPIILERGKAVRERRRDLAAINKQGIIHTESNYCFGEGGAGTYSDGKLYTRSNKRGDIQKVLQLLVQHGASADILVDARPHIGTNKLPQIITAIRETIQNAGGEIHFNAKVTDFNIDFGQIKGVVVNNEQIWKTNRVILATGHSAHDIYELLHQKQILVEAKPFALGVRIEHPQILIDQTQYHCDVRSKSLPPAYYNLVTQTQGNIGVFSFCMCPGGIIAPCATNENEIVVNGWSPSKRNNPFANSGTVVQIKLQDVVGDSPLKMMHFQRQVEQKAFKHGGGLLKAPAQRMVDFVQQKISTSLPENSYLPGTTSCNLNEVLPSFVSKSLREALPIFGQKMKSYFTNEAILVGVESRTSSPVRIPRDKESYQHPQVQGLYPCAEGAGYAGGIVSAAIDGINCVNAFK